jgi:hypothetical protein
MKRAPVNPFNAFCQKAFDFLHESGVRYLIIGGLAVGVVGEARTTGDFDVVGFASPEDAEALIAKAVEAGFDVRPDVEQERLRATGTFGVARRHLSQLDRRYLEATIQNICDLAEDTGPWHRLEDVLRKAAAL